jgi:predicted nucleic acid-binding protein
VRWLLDTCVLSETVKPKPEPAVLAWLDHHEEGDMAMSVLTLGELAKGIGKLAPGERRKRLEAWPGAMVLNPWPS